ARPVAVARRAARQRGHPRAAGAPHRPGRRDDRRDVGARRADARLRSRPRPARDQPQCRAARLQDPGLRQVQVRAAEESQRGPQKAEDRRDQGSQGPPQHRRPRLRREDARHEILHRRGRQGEGDAAVPGPRDGPPGPRHQGAGTHPPGARRHDQDRADASPREPADDHGAGAEV
ncbi:MAG: Translation initiation factor 3, partial [uncultured Acetobacteraceae bacterium]